MAGIKSLRKLTLGRETLAGTAVNATTYWRGVGTIEDTRVTTFPEEDVGYISGLDRSYQPQLSAVLAMESTPATFEQVLHILEAGVKLVGTGVSDGGPGASGKIYTYTFPKTSKNTIKTYTIYGGDDQYSDRMENAFVQDFKLTGKGGEAVMMEATWQARQSGSAAFAGSPTIPTVEEVLFSKGALYVDAVSGNFGGTIKSSTFLGFDLSVKTGWVPVFAANGQLYFAFAKITQPEVLLNITFEHDSHGGDQKAAWRAGTSKLVRLNFPGSTLGTAGTGFTTKVLRIDLAGRWEKFEKLGEENGNDILAGTFRARYNATEAAFAEIKVVNELATVP